MAKFVKGEIVCSSFDSRFIGVFEEINGDDNFVNCFIDPENKFNNYKGNFSGFQKTTRIQKKYFKSILLKHGYSYYKGKVTKEL